MSLEKLDTATRREQIVEAAAQLINAGGVGALSMAAVARRVGLVPSAIYRHFSGKEELIDRVLDHILAHIRANVEEVRRATPDPVRRLKDLLNRQVRLIVENRALARIAFNDEICRGNPRRRAALYAGIVGLLEAVAGIIRSGREDGLLPPGPPPETLALVFVGIVHPAAFLWHLSDGEFDLPRHVQLGWKLLEASLRGDAGSLKVKDESQ
ncbi:MAG TPA: TetR/AcrR family transcriptional regulator [bacterium]|nr:TetR/AcrR family transcriptional regulator [bacterium]HPQ66048.1 TetR/AcrR family transcriptional regulator [bacterium]